MMSVRARCGLALVILLLPLAACDKHAGSTDAAVGDLPLPDLAQPPNDASTDGGTVDLAVADGAEVDLATDDDLALLDAEPPADEAPAPLVTIAREGNGQGSVSSLPAGVDCGSTCSARFATGTEIMLTATPATGSEFAGWSGACTGTSPTCTITIGGDTQVSATFTLLTYTITVEKTGSGTISGNGFSCGATCELVLDYGTAIDLVATPDTDFHFDGWGGACTGKADCTFTVTNDATVSALFSQDAPVLLVTKVGAGGDVFAADNTINCGIGCTHTYTLGDTVTLTGSPQSTTTTVFAGWSGDCAGADACTLTMDSSKIVTATFAPRQYAINVSKQGQGTVSSDLGGLVCGAECSKTYDYNTSVTLTATPAPGWKLNGWLGGPNGNCSGPGPCILSMKAARDVTAVFIPDEVLLQVTKSGGGATTGVVTADTGALACGTQCSASYTRNAVVKLTASGPVGTVFTGWSGSGCNGTGDCTVTMSGAASVTAAFKRQYPLTVTKTGAGSGVLSSNQGIDCGSVCSVMVDAGAQVGFSYANDPGTVFAGWSGAGCSGVGDCTFTMDEPKSVIGAFDVATYSVGVIVNGPGTGTVTSASGILCGSDCSTSVTYGTNVTLVATPGVGSHFGSWTSFFVGGPCDGSTDPTCVIPVTQNGRGAYASFAQNFWDLAITKAGTGTGGITGTPGPSTGTITCDAGCASATGGFLEGQIVTLTATPTLNHVFSGWGGGICTGTGTCVVTMDQAHAVTATFDIPQRTLHVTKSGSGGGTITATLGVNNVPGLDCGADCNETFNNGDKVMLWQAPDGNSAFAGWDYPGCGVNAGCLVTMSADLFVNTRFEPKNNLLSVTRAGSGTGHVGGLLGIDCGSDCSESLGYGSTPTLSAAPDSGSSFLGWGGDCSGLTCTPTVDRPLNIVAYFGLSGAILNVAKTGTGTGTVSGTGINCGADCSELVALSTNVTLTAAASGGSTFTGWSGGGCASANPCIVNVASATTVTANFDKSPNTLTITKSGNGKISGTGIDCGGDCSESVAYGGVVTLTATPDPGQRFLGWGGPCSGTGDCAVQVTGATEVLANFATNAYVVTVTRSGSGTGSVTSAPPAIDCGGGTCSNTFPYGTVVKLTAAPGAGSSFSGWTGAGCSTGTCQFTVTGATLVDAAFSNGSFGLTTIVAGTGAGTITSAPAGISCPGDCNESYPYGTFVELTATPDATSDLTDWSIPGCGLLDTCVVNVDAARTVTATFTRRTYALTVAKVGTGTGKVTATGIDCGGDCSDTFIEGTDVTLTATADAGSTFSGWSAPGCPGTGTCKVKVDAAKSVTASFALQTHTVTITRAGGTGLIVVASTTPGVDGNIIQCGAQCTKTFPHGAAITLVPSALQNGVDSFLGWSNEGCSGTGVCTVTVTQDRAVTATFGTLNHMFVTSTTHTGNLGGLAGADAICQARADEAGLAGTYRAWLSTESTSAASRIGSARGWVTPRNSPVLDTLADIAVDNLAQPPIVDEQGVEHAVVGAQTATAPNGTFDTGAASSTCNGWTSALPSLKRRVGSITGNSSRFTSASYVSCDQAQRLYCFGIDRTTPLTTPKQIFGRRAFTTSIAFTPTSGLAGADQLCQNEAAGAGLPGTYRALLATSTSSALGRFDTSGNPTWYRVDGVVVATAAIFQFFVALTSAPNVNADNTLHFGDVPIWTGNVNIQAAGTLATTCNDWTSAAASDHATAGIAGDARMDLWLGGSGSLACDTPHPIVCLQQ